MPPAPQTWLRVTSDGLLVQPGGFHVDPVRPVSRAIVTHGHADHARPGHQAVLTTIETAAIMRSRMGEQPMTRVETIPYGKPVRVGDVTITLIPAGHILGSAQVVLVYEGCRVVVSGDYKRRADPTCAAFEPVSCDLFITEATFGLPVFRHPPAEEEIARALHTLSVFPERCLLIGVYALGKCQRVTALLRQGGYDGPVWLHGALMPLCGLYETHGVPLGDVRTATGATKEAMKGCVVLAPPSALKDRWTRRLPDPVIAQASGWMRVRQRVRRSGVELPLVISDHADWDELLQTIRDVEASEIWVTHGREDALVHAAESMGLRARALSLVGYEEEDGA